MNVELLKLKVKAKSLAEEAKIIRKLENHPADANHELYLHRVTQVRNEARATQLAIAFMKGKEYKTIEKSVKDPNKRKFYIIPRVLSMLIKYHLGGVNYRYISDDAKKELAEKLNSWIG
jgi:hypothetical protein